MAALWVVLYHLNIASTPVHGRLGPVVAHGEFGVDLFFMLSGFMLSLVYGDRLPEKFGWPGYRAFLSRRVAKLYPLHLITLLAMMLLVGAARHLHYNFTSGAENTWWTALCSALMLHSLGLTRVLSWNVPSWSISAEWFAYSILFMPMVYLLRPMRTAKLAAGIVALLVFMATLTRWLGDPWTRLTTRGAIRIVPEFLCGYLLWRMLRARSLQRGDLLVATGILLLLVACYAPFGDLWLMLPAIMLLLAGLYAGGPFADRVFGNRLLMVLGDASYSIYLVQTFVLIAAKLLLQKMPLADTVAARMAVAILVPSAIAGCGLLVFRWIEEPLRVALLHLLQGKRGNPERQPPPTSPGLHDDTQVSATIS